MEKRKTHSFLPLMVLSFLAIFVLAQLLSIYPVQARAPVVVINPGHLVGRDSGAVNGSTGVQEADLNAGVASKLAQTLKNRGYDVYLTHPVSGCNIPALLTTAEANAGYDRNESLRTIGNAVNAQDPDLTISIHHNSGGSSASGYEIYWSSYRDFDHTDVYTIPGLWGDGSEAYADASPCYAAQQSEVFAGIVEDAFEGFDIPWRNTVMRDDYLPAHATSPCILFEAGFVSNNAESLTLANSTHQQQTADRMANAVDTYFNSIGDTEAPTISSVTIPSSTSDVVFTVTANDVTDNASGIKNVRFAVWSDENGQDDLIWYDGSNLGNNQWSVNIDIRNHQNVIGLYNVHVYATDNAGNQTGWPLTMNVVIDDSIPDGVSCVKLSDNTYKVYAKGFTGYTEILFPTWSNNSGQDDIQWYGGSLQTDGSYAVTIDTSNHGYDTGVYAVDAYGRDQNGNLVILGSTQFEVPQMTAENYSISEAKDGKFTVTVSGINAPAGLREVLFPTWSEANGQDDIQWYAGERQSDGSYSYTVDISKHGYNTGTYNVHCYGRDNNGVLTGLAAGTTEVPQMTAENYSISEAKDGKFTVTVSGINAPAGLREVLFPTWSEANGQDDIQWYAGERQSDGSYSYTVDISKHGYNTGTYNVHCYGRDNNGVLTGLAAGTVQVETSNNSGSGGNSDNIQELTSIMGNTTVTAQQLIDLYTSSGNIYPSYYTENNRNVDLARFVELYIEEANAEGVRAEVAFAQAMKETGWLQFGGDVSISQFNFAGLGAIGGGASGMSFAIKYGDNENGIRMGIRAQIQHLKAYASTEPLNNSCVDERFNLVTRGCAPYVEWLGQKENPQGLGWATAEDYGNSIIDIMNRI